MCVYVCIHEINIQPLNLLRVQLGRVFLQFWKIGVKIADCPIKLRESLELQLI